MQKITIELDLDRPDDLQLLQVISRYKAEQAQGHHPSLKSVVSETIPSDAFPSAAPLHESAKEISRASNELGRQIGQKTTMTTKERASIAANARWAKKKALENGGEQAVAELQKKKIKTRRDDSAYAGAEEQSFADFPTQSAQDFVLNAIPKPPGHIDGRDIMNGTFQREVEFDGHLPTDLEDEFEEARRLAREYEQR